MKKRRGESRKQEEGWAEGEKLPRHKITCCGLTDCMSFPPLKFMANPGFSYQFGIYTAS